MKTDFQNLYDLVWRTDFGMPGYAAIDLPDHDSFALRRLMIEVQRAFTAISLSRGRNPFKIRSLGRFDQQVTTKFHLDGAPPESLLVLGYEPSTVRSVVRMADYSRAAHDLGMTPEEFLDRHNPMFTASEKLLQPYVDEIPAPPAGVARLVLVNNSKMPFDEISSQGVLHQATIPTPDPGASRIINSMMLATDGENVSEHSLETFLSTRDISGPIAS